MLTLIDLFDQHGRKISTRLCDEAQSLALLQLAMLEGLTLSARLVASQPVRVH